MTEPSARQRFAEMARADDSQLDLAEAALLIAVEEYPELELEPYQRYLEQRSTAVQSVLTQAVAPIDQITALNREIFEHEGFRGNSEDYYDPRNSFLNEVIDRRVGIPITLSIIYLEIGWRLGWPLSGVGMPGHFLVKFETGQDPLLVDPFAAGKILTAADCQNRLDQIYGGAVPLQPGFLASVSKRQILVRMLTNLKGIYFQRGDFDRALAAVDRVILLTPQDMSQFRDRGQIQIERGDLSAAASDLRTYLQIMPEPTDAVTVRRLLDEVWRRQSRMN